jgi:hypothetical protein
MVSGSEARALPESTTTGSLTNRPILELPFAENSHRGGCRRGGRGVCHLQLFGTQVTILAARGSRRRRNSPNSQSLREEHPVQTGCKVESVKKDARGHRFLHGQMEKATLQAEKLLLPDACR